MFDMMPQTIQAILVNLERGGLIVRSPHPEHGCVIMTELTTANSLCSYFSCGVGDLIEYVPNDGKGAKMVDAPNPIDFDSFDFDSVDVSQITWQDDEEPFKLPEPGDPEGVVILLGDMARDSIVTSVKSTGRSYISKLFWSNPSNWDKMADLINAYGATDSTQVVCQLTESALIRATCDSDYFDCFTRIKKEIASTRHLILIYHENMVGKFSQAERTARQVASNSPSKLQDWCDILGFEGGEKEAIKAMTALIADLIASGLNVAPYRTRVEFNASAHAFLSESSSGLVLRLYVPNDRLWGNELDHLLSLFRDYLKRVSGLPVTLNQNRTQHGISYNFYSEDKNFSQEKWADLTCRHKSIPFVSRKLRLKWN